MSKWIVKMGILGLLVSLMVPLLSDSPAAAYVQQRHHHFDRAAYALQLWGDYQGASTIRQMGHTTAVVPPELSNNARASFPGYANSYYQHRARVQQAIIHPAHPAEDQWRVDRAEADLHLVAYEMEQGSGRGAGSLPLIQQFLYDAWWALDHHIATELIGVPVAAPVVSPAGPTASISVSPGEIELGRPAQLAWNTTAAENATINGEVVGLSGQWTVSPSATSTYELVATGAGGRAADRTTLVVIVPLAPTASIYVTPVAIERGQSAILSWRTTNATSALINNEVVELNGQRTVSPGSTSEYQLVSTGAGGSARDRATLSVAAAAVPTASVSVTPDMIERGSSAQLSWTTANATRATINGEVVALAGSRTVMPTVGENYSLEATGPGGRASDRAVLVVTTPLAPTAELNVWPTQITEGECVTLTWMTRNATRVTINGDVVTASGEMRVCPTQTTTYELLSTGPGGRATDRELVTVTAVPRATMVPPDAQYRVHFDFDEAFIREDAKDTMAKVVALMRESADLQMRIEGNCDWKGTDAYNMALGMKRAESARDYFVNTYGLSPTRFTIVSFGESSPIADNAYPDGTDNPAGRQMNRRAVFVAVR